MWKLPDSVAQRFPLVARPRPACLPLPQRVQALTELANTAVQQGNASAASTVYNQAALIASDVGVPSIARAICHQHATAYLNATPLNAAAAIRALEPVVNLARLQIRAGRADDGRRHLLALYDAVTTGTGTGTDVEDIHVPAGLTAAPEDRHEIRAWLWRVLIADGTRTLTTAGRWDAALAHIKEHRGVGQRMLDGRQVAVLAALTTGDAHAAEDLLAGTEPGEPWEDAVTSCLTVLTHRAVDRPLHDHLQDLVATYLDRADEPGMTVFNTRLGLTVLDTITSTEDPAARLVVAGLHRRATETTDGYAAREILAHPSFTALATDQETQDCHALLQACALGAGAFPANLHNEMTAAIRASDHVIRSSAAAPMGQQEVPYLSHKTRPLTFGV
ncbi:MULTISPECIES: hypothetical protein [unclassified Streptomyces]|uniref:hypothetical protein n=1 Tax=unclassified Streptomyces TaxID=2593676 RepID=UPI00081DBE39|nr:MULTISPECIES: hypothetical protein [unclassified Streptomyces]SCF75257.1 hypothetical protein GA0115259_102049 [Streptomyces sp. MnatMP-M17]